MMKSLMLRSLTIIGLLSSGALFANPQTQDKVVELEIKKIQSIIKSNPNLKLYDMQLVLEKELPHDNWKGYVFELDLESKGQRGKQKHILFSNGVMSTPELTSVKTKRSYRDLLYPTLSNDYLSKKHLIAGDPNAPHSLVIFSDPLCPVCVGEIPFVIQRVLKSPKNIALYYYHMPLSMHPTAKTLCKASMIATEELGIKNVDYRVYDLASTYFYGEDEDRVYDPYTEHNQQKALDFFNKHFKTKITMAEINSKKYNDKLQYDMDMAQKAFVSGTPTMFFDKEIDKTRSKYKQYLK